MCAMMTNDRMMHTQINPAELTTRRHFPLLSCFNPDAADADAADDADVDVQEEVDHDFVAWLDRLTRYPCNY